MEKTVYDISCEGRYPGRHGIEHHLNGKQVEGREVTISYEREGETVTQTWRHGISVRLALDTIESGAIGMAAGVVIERVLVDRLKPLHERKINPEKVEAFSQLLIPAMEAANKAELTDRNSRQNYSQLTSKLGIISVSIEGYIIDGLSRWEAYKRLNIPQIACIVVNVLKEEESEEFNKLISAVEAYREKKKREHEDAKRRLSELETKIREYKSESAKLARGYDATAKENERLKKELTNQTKLANIDSSLQYHALTRAMVKGQKAFTVDDDYAYTNLTSLTGRTTILSINPENGLFSSDYVIQIVNRLNDETADTLDILFDKWISSSPKHKGESIVINVDDILRARGIQEQKGGSGRRGGYSQEKREHVREHLQALSALEIKGTVYSYKDKRDVSYTSRVIAIMETIGNQDGQYIYDIAPGRLFSDNLLGLNGSRQVAKISRVVVAYDPYRQRWEKRTGRYFSWIWRVDIRNTVQTTVKVDTLLDVMDDEKQRPNKTRDALENALDTLAKDGVIKGWNYSADFNEDNLSGRNWFNVYKDCKIEVYAPEEIQAAYAQITSKQPIRQLTTATPKKQKARLETTVERLKRVVKEKALSTRQAAEQIGLSKSGLSLIIKGTVPTEKAAKKIEAWLQK